MGAVFLSQTLSEDLTSTKTMGVEAETLKPGDGATFPTPGSRVTCHYVLTLTDGKKIDSSRDRGQPFQFSIGKGEVIAGWDEGVAKMSKGQRARLTISPDLGYGAQVPSSSSSHDPSTLQGVPGMIPPNSTLVFDVELLNVA